MGSTIYLSCCVGRCVPKIMLGSCRLAVVRDWTVVMNYSAGMNQEVHVIQPTMNTDIAMRERVHTITYYRHQLVNIE